MPKNSTVCAKIRSESLFASMSYMYIESTLLPATNSLPSDENFTEKIPKEYPPSSFEEKSKPSWISCILQE